MQPLETERAVDFMALEPMSIDYSESKNMLQKDSKTRELDLKLHVVWIERQLERISLAGCLAMTSVCTKPAKEAEYSPNYLSPVRNFIPGDGKTRHVSLQDFEE